MEEKINFINKEKNGVFIILDKNRSIALYKKWGHSNNVLAVPEVYNHTLSVVYYTNNKNIMKKISKDLMEIQKHENINIIDKHLFITMLKLRLKYWDLLYFKENLAELVSLSLDNNYLKKDDIPTDIDYNRIDESYHTLIFNTLNHKILTLDKLDTICNRLYDDLVDDLAVQSFKKSQIVKLNNLCSIIDVLTSLKIDNKLLNILYYLVHNVTFNRILDKKLLLKLYNYSCYFNISIHNKSLVELYDLDLFVTNKNNLKCKSYFKNIKELQEYCTWNNKRKNCGYKLYVDTSLDKCYIKYINKGFDYAYPVYIRNIDKYVMVYQILTEGRLNHILAQVKPTGKILNNTILEDFIELSFNDDLVLMHDLLEETIIQLGMEHKIHYNTVTDGKNHILCNLKSLLLTIPLNNIGYKNNKFYIKLNGPYKCENLPTLIRYENNKFVSLIQINVVKFNYINSIIPLFTYINDFEGSPAMLRNLKKIMQKYNSDRKISTHTKQIYYDTIIKSLELLDNVRLDGKDKIYINNLNNLFRSEVLLDERVN